MDPLISIVVPTLNQGAFIEQTLASLAAQRWPRLEVIVMDGGSTDDTAAIVERYRDLVTHFVSEPDKGQADAINKGFRAAKGDILAWLNSDDMYMPCTLPKIARHLPDPKVPALVHGGVLLFWEGRPRAQAWLPVADVRERIKTTAAVYQPTAFWTRALWEKTGELNPEYHFVLDWDWFARALAHGEVTAIPELLALYRFHAGHKSSSGQSRRTQEILEMIDRLADPAWAAAFRDVAAQLPRFAESLDWLRKRHLYWLRKLVHRDLYGRHGGAKVKVALSQLHV
jgi:glycosyltransferase involved in cell wall biosynthesis